MSADDENRNGELERDARRRGRRPRWALPGERDLGPDEPGGSEPPPEPPSPEFLADAGTADIGMPDEQAADELVGDDMDAAEWAALAAPCPRRTPVDARRAGRASTRRRSTARTTAE